MKYKTTQKDRYGNMRSLEIDTGEKNMEVPPMTSMIPQYEAVGGLAENHPGEPKGSDTVPAWLTPGEFVVNKEAVDIYGPQIKKMNDVGREIQDGNISPSEASQIPMYASTGKAAKEYPAEKKLANQIEIYEHLKSRGLSDKAVAGLMAQIQHESAGTFDHQWQEHSGGGGHGLFQMDPNPGGWLGPYKQWLRKKYMDDINKMELEPVVPGGPVLNPTMQFDSPQNQLDFAIDLYTNPNAIPHPTDPGHYFIGDQNAASIRSVLGNPDVDLTEMSNILVDTWINPKEKIKYPENRIDRQEDTQAMWDLIQSGAFIGAQDPSAVPTWITRAQQIWQDMDKPKVEIPEVDPSASSFLSRWFPGHSGKKSIVPKLDSSDPYDFKNKGGPIYAYSGAGVQGPGLGTWEEEMLKNLQHDYGNPWNPFDNIYSVGMDYGHRPIPDPATTEESWYSQLKNEFSPAPSLENIEETTTTDDNQVYVPGWKKAIAEAGQFDDANVNTIEDMEDVAGDKLRDLYFSTRDPEKERLERLQDGMIEVETLPPLEAPPTPREMGYGNLERKKWFEFDPYTDIPGGGNVKELEDQYLEAVQTVASSNSSDPDYQSKMAWLNKVTAQLEQAKSNQNIIREWDAFKAGNEKTAKFEKESEKNLSEIEKTKKSIEELKNRIAESSDQLLTEKLNKQLIQQEIKLNELEYKNVSEHSNPENYKKSTVEKLKERLDPKEETFMSGKYKYSDAEDYVEAQNNAQQKNIVSASEKVAPKVALEIESKLNTQAGKKAIANAESKSETDPEKTKARKMFDFLFGDLIDQGEIGRAIAVYLGSRAMGYDHGSSFGYVARQYLARVDKKNAMVNKFLLENAGKYTPASVKKFKKTGNPADLIPIGSTPYATGVRKKYYSTNPKLRGGQMAYEFKVKNAQGNIATFWSFDSTGRDDSLRLRDGWQETDPNLIDDKEISHIEKIIRDFQSGDGKKTTGSSVKGNLKTIYWETGDSTPGMSPAAAADEIAGWLTDRGIKPGKIGQAIHNAYAAMIAKNKKLYNEDPKTTVRHESLIPFLEDELIKMRLEDMRYLDANNKMHLIPSPVKAKVNGEERVMSNDKLKEIQNRVEEFYGPVQATDLFWAEISKSWEQHASDEYQEKYQKKGGKKVTWKEVFMEMAKEKKWSEYTPFGLFALSAIEQQIEAASNESYQPQ